MEALADMTPEQLEAIEGIGPKTVEKISVAVNNYFATLEGAEGVALEGGEGVALPENEGIATERAVEAEPAPTETEEVEAEAAAPDSEPSGETESTPEAVEAEEQKE